MQGEDAKRLRATVHGVVQGVGFRAFVAREARRLRLSGWVRNREDGSVELEAEGPEARVRELARQVRQGPPGSRVSDLDLEWCEARRAHQGFSIRY